MSRKAHMGQTQPAPCTLTAPHTLVLCPQTPRDPPVAMQDPGNNSSRGTELSPKPSPCPFPSPKSAVLQPNGKPKPTKLQPGATPVVPPALHTHTDGCCGFPRGQPSASPQNKDAHRFISHPLLLSAPDLFILTSCTLQAKASPASSRFQAEFWTDPHGPFPIPNPICPCLTSLPEASRTHRCPARDHFSPVGPSITSPSHGGTAGLFLNIKLILLRARARRLGC